MPKINYYQNYKQKNYVQIFDAKVLEILELNKDYPEQYKLKTVFTCESVTGTPRVCVYWGNKINLAVGDLVNMEGHYKNNVFVATTLLYKKIPPEKTSGDAK